MHQPLKQTKDLAATINFYSISEAKCIDTEESESICVAICEEMRAHFLRDSN